MKNFSAFVLFLSLATAILLAGCGGSILNPDPVGAQEAYSNASISGDYAVTFTEGSTSGILTSIGTLTADGNGNIASGKLSTYGTQGACSLTFTGSYQMGGSTGGTMAVTAQPSARNGCAVAGGGGMQFAFQVAQQGSTILLTESDGTALASGIAVKQ